MSIGAQASRGGFAELLTSPGTQVTRDLYGSYLANALRNNWAIPDPSFALLREPNIYWLMERDSVIAQSVQGRKHAVAGAEHHVEPGDDDDDSKELAELVYDALGECENLESAKLNLADAIFTGSAYAKIIGQRRLLRLGADKRARAWWVPTRLADIDRLRVRWKPDPATRMPVLEIRSVYGDNGGQWGQGAWKPVDHPEWLVQHVYDDRERTLGYGNGLMNALYYYYYSKTVVFQKGLQGLDRWCQGFLSVKLDPNRAASSGKDNDTLVSETKDMLNKTRTEHYAVFGVGDEIELLDGPGVGHEMVKSWLSYLDDGIRGLVMGSMLPSGGGGSNGTGSLARAEVEQDTSESLFRFDRALLEQTFSRQVIGLFINLNRANLAEMGLSSAARPKFSLRRESKPDPKSLAETIVAIKGAGLPIPRRWAYEALNIPPPAPDEEVLGPSETSGLPGMGEGSPFGGSQPFGAKPKDAPSEPSPDKERADKAEAAKFAAIEDRAEFAEAVATREPAPIYVNVTVPPNLPTPVNVMAPVVNVEAARAPDVRVEVQAAKAPDVSVSVSPTPVTIDNTVNVPRGEAPVVSVTTPTPVANVTVNVPKPEGRVIEIRRDVTGKIIGGHIEPETRSA